MPLFPPARPLSLIAGDTAGGSLWFAGSAETGSRPLFGGDVALASGVAQFGYFSAPVANTVTKLGASTGSVAASALTLVRVALYTAALDDSLTKVAQIAVQTSATFGTGTFGDFSFSLATAGGFPASYTFTAGARYALGILQVGTTPASLRWSFPVNSSAAPVLARTVGGQSDLSASYAVGSLAADYQLPYLFATP